MRKETSTNFQNEQVLANYCNAYKTLQMIGGRWKLSVLFALAIESKSYSQLKVILPQMSDRILSLQLKELIKDDLVINEKDKTKSIYYLSDKGKRFSKVLEVLSSWEG